MSPSNPAETIDKIPSVSIAAEYVPWLDTTTPDMMERSGGIYAGLARHAFLLPSPRLMKKGIISWASPLTLFLLPIKTPCQQNSKRSSFSNELPTCPATDSSGHSEPVPADKAPPDTGSICNGSEIGAPIAYAFD